MSGSRATCAARRRSTPSCWRTSSSSGRGGRHRAPARLLPYLRIGGAVFFECPQERGYASDVTHVRSTTGDDLAELRAQWASSQTRRSASRSRGGPGRCSSTTSSACSRAEGVERRALERPQRRPGIADAHVTRTQRPGSDHPQLAVQFGCGRGLHPRQLDARAGRRSPGTLRAARGRWRGHRGAAPDSTSPGRSGGPGRRASDPPPRALYGATRSTARRDVGTARHAAPDGTPSRHPSCSPPRPTSRSSVRPESSTMSRE